MNMKVMWIRWATCLGFLSVFASPSFAQSPSSISITSPGDKSIFQHIKGVADISVTADALNVPDGGGVQLVIDIGTAAESSTTIKSSPYSCVFKDVRLGEHTIDAFIVDSSNNRTSAHDSKTRVGVGDIIIAMGDSITAGEVDDIISDNWSSDGRNGPYVDWYTGTEYGGFEPILNDLLTSVRGYPHSVINMGYPGDKASDGVAKVAGIIAQYPTAATWLIAYGANDAATHVSPSLYKQNLQTIMNAIHGSIPNAKIYLPHILYRDYPVIPSLHNCLGDLIRNNDNVFWGADLETLFKANHSLYDHLSAQPGTWLATTKSHHPNGIGCQVMAKLWEMALVDGAFLVSDGVLPSLGNLWADGISLNGLDKIGLNEDNLLQVRGRWSLMSPIPKGITSVPNGWLVNLFLTGAKDFANGQLSATMRVDCDNLPLMTASSWNQVWLCSNSTLLDTSRQVDAMSSRNEDLTATFSSPGQLLPVADITPPKTDISVFPSSPDGEGGVYINPPTITLKASDDSGLPVTTYYCWDNNSISTEYISPIIGMRGTHTFHYWSVDASGNVEPTKIMSFAVMANPPIVSITNPVTDSILQQISGKADITVTVNATGIPAGGALEFVLDAGSSASVDVLQPSTVTSYTFTGVSVGEHTVDVYILTNSGMRIAHDSMSKVGVGDIIVAFGDDITMGDGDDVSADDVSSDGRNGPVTDPLTGQEYAGFEPILNNLLSSDRNCPTSVVNEGSMMDNTESALGRIGKVIAKHPTARTWLVGYGMYDLASGICPTEFKANIQKIVSAIQTSNPDAVIYLPKVFFACTDRANDYNRAIGEIIQSTRNVRRGADLDSIFRGNCYSFDRFAEVPGSLLSNTILPTPNGLGYQMIAKLWELNLTQRAILVTDGSVRSIGDLGADKLQLTGTDRIGLSNENLLIICEQHDFARLAVGLCTTFSTLSSSGKLSSRNARLTVGIRADSSDLQKLDCSSWSQVGVRVNNAMLSTYQTRDAIYRDSRDYFATTTQLGAMSLAVK